MIIVRFRNFVSPLVPRMTASISFTINDKMGQRIQVLGNLPEDVVPTLVITSMALVFPLHQMSDSSALDLSRSLKNNEKIIYHMRQFRVDVTSIPQSTTAFRNTT